MAGKWQEGKNRNLTCQYCRTGMSPCPRSNTSRNNRSSSSQPSTESIKTLVMPTSRRPPLLLAYRFLLSPRHNLEKRSSLCNRSLGPCFLCWFSAFCQWYFSRPRWVSYLSPTSNCTCTPASSQWFPALLSITFPHLRLFVCDPVIHTRSYILYTPNIKSGPRPKFVFATGPL